jgi:hypothetical protein
MPDDRLFHKRLGHSHKVNQLTDFEDRVWRAYVLSADDFGIMRFVAVAIQADHDYCAVKPSRVVQKALERVRDVGLIVTFEHQGHVYCAQPDWQNHQRVKFPRQTINPKPTDEILATFTPATQALFADWPGKKSGKLPEDSPNPSAVIGNLAHARPREMANANGYRPTANANGSGTVDEVSERAGRFVNEVYPQLYAKHRKGARYISRPTLDFQEALQLCRTWDDERLVKIATVFLTTDHEFAEKGSRTMAQFRSLASWCDSRLAEAGIA